MSIYVGPIQRITERLVDLWNIKVSATPLPLHNIHSAFLDFAAAQGCPVRPHARNLARVLKARFPSLKISNQIHYHVQIGGV